MSRALTTAGIRRAAAIGLGVLMAIVPVIGAAGASERTAVQRIPMAVSEIGILNVNGNSEALTIRLRGAAKRPGEDAVLADVYVQYSMIVPRNQKRCLTARLEGVADIPPGCTLKLRAEPSGRKNEGVSQGSIVLTRDPQAILNDIGSCATGTGAADGARLVFTLAGLLAQKAIPGDFGTAKIILDFN